MDKAAGYKQLVDRFGVNSVADRLLQKWLSDPDADEKWERLAAHIEIAVLQKEPQPTKRRPYKYWVILWYVSMGFSEIATAEQLGVSRDTIKMELKYARRKLGMVGGSLPAVVAKAYRLGMIP